MSDQAPKKEADHKMIGATGSARIADSVDYTRTPEEEIEAAKAERKKRKPLYGTTK